MTRPPAINPVLWKQVQSIVYPKALPSDHPPFERVECSERRMIASWLYYRLLDDAELRAKVLP